MTLPLLPIEVDGIGRLLVVPHARERLSERGLTLEDMEAALAANVRKVGAALHLSRGINLEVALGRMVVVLARRGSANVVVTAWARETRRAAMARAA